MGNHVSVTSHLIINTERAYADSLVNNHDMDRILAVFSSQNGKDNVLWRVLLAHIRFVTILSIALTPMGKAGMKAFIFS